MNPAKQQNTTLGLIVAAAMAGPTLYWGFTYTGPFRYLAELQLKWFGVYYPEVTGITIILGMLCVAGIIKLLFRGAERAVPGTAAPAPASTQAAMTAALEQRWLAFLPCFVGLIIVGIGAHDFYKGTHTGKLQQLNAADFFDGKLQSRVVYADVRGRLSGRYLTKEGYYYVPMVGEEKTAGPIRVVVGGNKNDFKKALHREADGTVQVWGIADKGLEGDVKYAFEKNGSAVGDTVWVLHAGRAPSDERGLGLFMMGFGIVCAGLLYGAQRFREKRAAAKLAQAIA